MFQFTPLLGAQSTSRASQSLLELDGGVKILVDVGWDEQFDVGQLAELERHLQSISFILLTHSTPAHLAAFAHCCKHFPSFQQIPIYATVPVISLGQTLLQDIYSSTPLASTVVPRGSLAETSYSFQSSLSDETLDILLQPPTTEEISKYFSLIHSLKYSQPHQPSPSPFSPPLNDLTITAYNAGHSLGGTIWHIQYGMESIVYAVDWNQVRENVFAGASWLGGSGGGGTEVIEQLRKPTALVCSARGAERVTAAGGRKKRDELLLDQIRNAIAQGGTVLIPADSSARVLELAYVLEHAWRKDTADLASERSLRRARLYFASRTANSTMRYVRSMLEWMDENVVKEFESEASSAHDRRHRRGDSKQNANHNRSVEDSQSATVSSNPFEFHFLKMIDSKRKLEKTLSSVTPRVILASDSSLEWGLSKDVLQSFAKDPANLLILTDDNEASNGLEGPQRNLSRTIHQWCQDRGFEPDLHIHDADNRELEIKQAKRVPLEGKELLVYQQYLATRRQSQGLSQTAKDSELEATADAVDETSSASSSSSEESNPEVQGRALNVSAKAARFNRGKAEPSKEQLGVNVLLRQPGNFDYDVRGKKGRDQMFPFLGKRRRADDFGDLIKPEDYLRAEEKIDAVEKDVLDPGLREHESLGQKRKWQDSSAPSDVKTNGEGPNKHRKSGARHANLNGFELQKPESSSESSDEEADLAVSVPSKLETTTDSIMGRFKIAFADFSGMHDQRSLTMLIPLIRPQKLILIGGSPSETAQLAQDCRQKLGTNDPGVIQDHAPFVFTPNVGEVVDASVDTNAWTVKLSDDLVRRLHWQKVRGLSVVTLMGLLSATKPMDLPEDAARRKKLKAAAIEEDEVKPPVLDSDTKGVTSFVPILDVLPTNMAAATRSAAQPLHVGDLRLADLRKMLQSSGHTADFRGEGTLLIDGLVAVRKSANGRIEVEYVGRDLSDLGIRSLEGPFYAVKRKIYECLAVIAGG